MVKDKVEAAQVKEHSETEAKVDLGKDLAQVDKEIRAAVQGALAETLGARDRATMEVEVLMGGRRVKKFKFQKIGKKFYPTR